MKKKITYWISNNALLLSTVIGVIFGVALGFCFRAVSLSSNLQDLVSYPGELFARALQMMILPLIVSSLIIGSASLNAKMNGKIAIKTLLYFITTSFFNALLGVLFAITMHPGNPDIKPDMNDTMIEVRPNTLQDNLLDLGRNLIPANIFVALFQQTQTVYESSDMGNDTVRSVVLREGTNSLGLITVSLIFGSVLGTLGERSKQLIDFFRVVDEVIMCIIRGIMWITPLGVCSIIASKIVSVKDIATITTQLGMFVLTVAAGIYFYQFVLLQLIYFVIKRKNPFKFYFALLQATVTAFSTASAAVTLPVSIRLMDKLKYDTRITHFVLPIGASINKDGTALFVAVASIFIAQMNNITLSAGDLITVAITSTAVSIASASIPSAALALMFIVLNAVGVPTQDIGLLFAVDWFTDRMRTTNNLLGDCYATVFVEHFSQKELAKMDGLEGKLSNGHGIHNGGNYIKEDKEDNISSETPIDL